MLLCRNSAHTVTAIEPRLLCMLYQTRAAISMIIARIKFKEASISSPIHPKPALELKPPILKRLRAYAAQSHKAEQVPHSSLKLVAPAGTETTTVLEPAEVLEH